MRKILMRRGEAIEMLGVGKNGFAKLVKAGKLRPFFLPGKKKNGRAYWKTEEIERMVKEA
jgi:predicted site-specific integrase-resolvase